jgi:hypothetical protein
MAFPFSLFPYRSFPYPQQLEPLHVQFLIKFMDTLDDLPRQIRRLSFGFRLRFGFDLRLKLHFSFGLGLRISSMLSTGFGIKL